MFLIGITLLLVSYQFVVLSALPLELFPDLRCSYNYDLQVHTHRGDRSTKELNFKINTRVDLDVIGRHPEDIHESVYVVRLQLRQLRIVRSNNGRPIKHAVDRDVEKKLSKPFFFLRDAKGGIREVFYPHEDQPDVVGLKKGVVSALILRLHNEEQRLTYEAEEEDDSGIHVTYYNVSRINSTHIDLTKKWTGNNYRKHADGRPVNGRQYHESHYHTTVKIENSTIKTVDRIHWSYFNNDKPYNRALNRKYFPKQPDFDIKASGESQLRLVRCSKPMNSKKTKRSLENERVGLALANLKRDSLSFSDMHRLKWFSEETAKKTIRTLYELLRCHWDSSVKESELAKCIRELHVQARTHDGTFRSIVNLTLERSHQNISTWSALVGSLVVRGDNHNTQKILARVLISEGPRPLTDKEHSVLLEAVYFIPAGPLYQELLQALISVHRNLSKTEDVSAMAMLVVSGLVKRSHEAGYNSSLSDMMMDHLENSFKDHPARYHDEVSDTHEAYLRNHLWAFGNLGHPSSLEIITPHLDHDNSAIRYSAVLALRKIPSQRAHHHLLRVLKHDEHVTVKTGVIEVFIERQQNFTEELRGAIEDAMWKSDEGDELDMAITEFLEDNGENSHLLRKRREVIRRRKRALIPALKPREFTLGPRKNWRYSFGGSLAGAEAMMRFINQVKLRIGIFGGSFEVDLNNAAEFNAHVFKWSFNVLKGKAAFKMSARFKNDIPKDLIHTISDTADDVLSKVDALSSIFAKHLQDFINKLKNYLPLSANQFLEFIAKAAEFLKRTIQSTRFGRFFNEIVKNLKKALGTRGFWSKIAKLANELLRNLAALKVSNKPFAGAFEFLGKLMKLVLSVNSELPQGLPVNFNVKEFLKHISGPYSSVSVAADDYFKSLGVKVPGNLYEMLHFNITLRYPVSLNQFNVINLRLLDFGNNFLEMFSVFGDTAKIGFPRLRLPEFAVTPIGHQFFDFHLSFDWKIRFNFKVDFANNNFVEFKRFFVYLSAIFRKLDDPNVNLDTFFQEFLPQMRSGMKSTNLNLFKNTTGLNDARWFRAVIQEFKIVLRQQDKNLLDFSDTSTFLEEVAEKTEVFSKIPLNKVCKFQGFMLKSSGKLQSFGENLESEAIDAIKKIEKETQSVIGEVVNVTLFVDKLIDELKKNLSNTAKEFVDTFLDKLEGSLGNVKKLADNIAEFTSNSSEKLIGFCHKAADLSGEHLDQIQSEAEKAVGELASFIALNPSEITDLVSKFKTAIANVEKWHEKHLEKRLGKFVNIAQTLEELLSLLKNENDFWKKVHEISTIINDVAEHLQNLPEYAQKAREAADKVTDFATNATLWKTEVNKLNIRRRFKLDFDDQFRKLCGEFETLAQDTIKKIQGDELFKTFRQFVTKETDALISRAVGKLDLLKQPAEHVRQELEKISDSVGEVGAVLTELRPFSNNFSPILKEVSQLPNCSEIENIFGNVINRCVKNAKAFGKQAYSEYANLQSDVGVFLELIPDEWGSMNGHKCINGGTCLSEAFTKQAQEISSKMKKLRKKFESKELSESLASCKDSVEEVAAVINKIERISKLVQQFTVKDDMKIINDLVRRITGRFSEKGGDSRVQKRSLANLGRKVKKLADHIKKATETKDSIGKLVEEVFEKLKSVHRDDIEPFQENLKSVELRLGLSFELAKKSGVINSNLQAVGTVVAAMDDFTNVVRDLVDPMEGTVLDVLLKTSVFTDAFDDKLKYYGNKVKKVSDEVNGFLDKLTGFLNTIQLRQKGLDIRDYKPWDQYSYCSQEVCLRPLRRSSKLYLNIAFLWKYPHLDDLSSLPKTGKWLVPGLFDDYKVRGIAQLSGNEMLLGMRGVASNTDKASLLVVVDSSSKTGNVLKIFELQRDGQPFKGEMGGVAILKSTYIWMSSGKDLYAVRLSDVRSKMSTDVPSLLNIVKTKTLSHEATSVSYDVKDHMVWVVDTAKSKAYSYKVSPFGDILSQNNALKTGQYTRALTIVRQFGVKYACVAKCALVAGYQCKLEFHNVKTGILDDSSLHRVVRTPTGLESVQTIDSEIIVTAFSSGTFSEKDKIERVAGDFEDRFFKLKLPILTTGFSVTENCIFLKVGSDWIIPAKRLFPVGEKKCGSRRKRSALEEAMDSDVYTDELAKQHKRVRRQATETETCVWNYEGDAKRGRHAIFPKVSLTVPVFGISVRFFFGVDGHYYANYRLSLCLRDKQVKLALIPGAWFSVYAGASLAVFIVEAGVAVEAKLLETYLIPEIGVRIDKWPLSACLELKMQMTPLSIRVYLWYRFRLCVEVDAGFFYLHISINWCRKNTFAEWSWSLKAIHRTLFSNCKKDMDRTPPEVGVCSAKQVGNKKYLIQWRGFVEDTKIQHYIVTIGSIKGSGDDHYSILGVRQTLLVPDLEIMHGRSVYVAVYATNGAGLKSPVAECSKFTAKRRSPVVTFINDGDSAKDIDYQTDPTSVAMNYGLEEDFTEISRIQWGISSSSKCTLSDAEADVLSLRDIGESLSITKAGMSLANGGKYYTRVVIINHLGLATVACSDGVVVDTTPPFPRGFSIGKEGSTFIPSLKMVSGKFEDFVDMESPIVHYEWKLVDGDTGADIIDFKKIPLTQKSPLLDGLSLIGGKKYTAVLKGINAAGLYSEVNVSGVIPDETVPVCEGPVRDVINPEDDQDHDFVRQLGNLTARFVCYDQDSGIQSIEAAVGTYPRGENLYSFVNIQKLQAQVSSDSKTTWVVFTNVTLTSLVRYYVTVKVRNNAGLSKTLSSDGILVDTTGPTVLASYIRDGYEGTDKKFSRGNDVFAAHWENAFVDAESGIGEYYVGLGTSPGLDDQSEFKSYSLSTQTVISGVALESGVTYYVTVIGCNRVHTCVNASSNGAMVDFIPPHTGLVLAGRQGPSTEVTWINKAAWARWQWCPADKAKYPFTTNTCKTSSFYDKHSGIRQFGLSVLSYDTAKLLTPVKTVGRVVVSGRHVAMPNGVFSVVVEAIDRAGVRASSVSKSFIVDTTPPEVVWLYHGNEYEPLMFTRTKKHVFTAYVEITEDVSNVITYSVGVGSYPGGNDILPFVAQVPRFQSDLLRANWTASVTTTLVNERKYYITVKATNSAGLFVVAASESLIFDDDKPTVGYVFDGWGPQDAQYHLFPTIYRMHWRGLTDTSGIKETKICLSSSRDENNCDIHPKIVISNKDSSHSFINLRLQSGMYCYALLQLKDNAGNLGNYWSNGALVDTSPPTSGKVRDGQKGETRQHQQETNILHASWFGFSENETSIHHYELAFGTRKNSSDVQPFTNVGLVTSAASSNLLVPELKDGVVYYASVVAYNLLGIPSKVASSEGILVDSTPPTFSSPVSDGATFGTDVDYSKDDSSLSVNWKCVDKDSGLGQAFVGFGTQPGIQDVASFRVVLPHQTLFKLKNVTLSQGFRYFATVKCGNKVGLHTAGYSDGLTFDVTPPTLRFVHDGLSTHNDASYVGLASFISANWKFVDPESHVVSHHVSIKSLVNRTTVVGPRYLAGDKTSIKFRLQTELKHGEHYFISITARNGAGLNTSGNSSGFVVDATAPVCYNVYDASVDGTATKFVGHITKLAVHFRCEDKETGIFKYQFSIRNIITSQYVLPFHNIKGVSISSSLAVVDGSGKRILQLKNGGRYQIGLRATNMANLTKEYWTQGVTIDLTPPVFTKVLPLYDVQSDSINLTWKLSDDESKIKSVCWSLNTSPDVENSGNFTQISEDTTELIISELTFQHGQGYYIYLKATNMAGLSTLFVSNGVLIDRTSPSAGRVSAGFVVPLNYDGNPNVAQGASFATRWSGFIDEESGIRSYNWAVGLSNETTKVLGDESYTSIPFTGTLNGYVIKNQTIYTDTTYYVCIRVSNNAGLTTTNCSEGVFVKLGKLTAGVVYDGPLANDIDFQLDDKAVWLHWNGFEDPVYKLKNYEWCYGLLQSDDADHINCTTSLTAVNPALKTSAHQFHNVSLVHGWKYSVEVRGFNGRGQNVSAISDGFTVDRTAPLAGLIDISSSQSDHTVYLPGLLPPTVTWSMNDPESLIEEFILSVGNLPGGDDLLPYTKLDGDQRSVNLDDMNFTLTHGMSFFITITGKNILGLEHRVTSSQVIVDSTPPFPGQVLDGNGTKDVDFQASDSHVSATWSEFSDPESDVVEYKYCIGTRPDFCDVYNLTSVDLKRRVEQQIDLEHGITYFVTVTAINRAGLSSTASSNGVTIDTTPPSIQGFSIPSIPLSETETTDVIPLNTSAFSIDPWTISASWVAINDNVSDVKRVLFCAGSVKQSCDLISWTELDQQESSLRRTLATPLQSGSVYAVSLKVENGAGLHTIACSDTVMVDATPPLPGNVRIAGKLQLAFLREGQAFLASWQDFKDLESGIEHYEWKICLSSQPMECVSSFVNVAKNTSLLLNNVPLEHGKQYVLIVKALNNAGLEIEAESNPFVLDKTPPEAGMVIGGKVDSFDQLFQSSSSEISVNWKGFQDKESGISRYSVCIGSSPGICDVRPYKNVGLTRMVTIEDLNLTHNTTYFVSIQALNGAGESAFASSDGINVDLTPPVGGKLRDGEGNDVNITVYDSFVSGNWDTFSDPESKVVEYVICAGTAKDVCDILELTDVTGKLFMHLQVWPSIASGTTVFLTMKVYNGAGGVSFVHSDGVLVDRWIPDAGKVTISSLSKVVDNIRYFTSKTPLCCSWSGFNQITTSVHRFYYNLCLARNPNLCAIKDLDLHNRTSVCIDDPPLEEGVKYFVKLQATNAVGLSSTAVSPLFLVDTTEPDVGEVTVLNPKGEKFPFISSELLAQWNGFVDLESTITEYFTCVGTKPGLCDAAELVSAGNMSRYRWSGLNLTHNEEYFVSLKAINSAGLSSNFSFSEPISVDKTAPKPQLVSDGNDDSKDLAYQQSTTHVAATWLTVEDPESDVITVTWCVGTSRRVCDLKQPKSLHILQTEASSFLNQPLGLGAIYYVTLMATNGAGLTTTMVSDGVVIDYTPPTAGLVIDGSDSEIEFVTDGETVYASWSGFEDRESNVEFYEFALCETQNVTACPFPLSNIKQETNMSLSGLLLTNGKEYVVIVRATNMAGLSSEAKSDGFIFDSTEPVAGNIWIDNQGLVWQNNVSARWNDFEDLQSGIAFYEICIRKSGSNCNENDFKNVGEATSYLITSLDIEHLGTYYVTVQAINNAEMSSRQVSEVIRIDSTPPRVDETKREFSKDLDENCVSEMNQACEGFSNRQIQISCIFDYIEARWPPYEDQESGIAKVEWCIETVHNTCNVRYWENIDPGALNGSAVISSLPTFKDVRVSIRITNGVGNTLVLSSPSCNSEKSFPPKVEVREIQNSNHTGTDIDYQTDLDAIFVTWNYAGNVTVYPRTQVALANSSPKSEQSTRFLDVPLGKNQVVFTNASLKPYTKYHAVVRIWDEFGLYSDSVSDGVTIVPDHPLAIEINITDKLLANGKERWQKYLNVMELVESDKNEEMYYIPDPFSTLINLGLEHTHPTNVSGLEARLKRENAPILYKATIHRITTESNEVDNATANSRIVYNQSHVFNYLDTCCSRRNAFPRTIIPDKQLKPVRETVNFGNSIATLGNNNLFVVSSFDAVYVFSTATLADTPLIFRKFDSAYSVRIKTASDKLLISRNGRVLLFDVNMEYPAQSVLQIAISNCNYTMNGEGDHDCVRNDAWSSSEAVGKTLAYDSSKVIAVGGFVNDSNSGVVAVFDNQSSWKLRQVLGLEKNDSLFGRSIAINRHFLVVLGGGFSEITLYSKTLDNSWKEEKNVSDVLFKAIRRPSNVYLTDENELFVISTKDLYLDVFQLAVTSKTAILKCRYSFPNEIQLSGNLDITKTKPVVVAVGIMSEGSDGAALLAYDPNEGFAEIGSVLNEPELRLDDGIPLASVALHGDYVIIGTPQLPTWHSEYERGGTGRVYLATFCPRNSVRGKGSKSRHAGDVACVSCGAGEKSYPGFEESCVDCSRKVCLDNPSLNFEISQCAQSARTLNETRAVFQNTSADNLTVSEITPIFGDGFYRAGGEQSYFVRISQLSTSGLETISDSALFSIDNTSPEPGYVYDGKGSDESHNCSANTTFGSRHQCSTRSFSDTDIDFTNNTAEIIARWIDFRDNESGIQNYLWCIGSSPLSDDILKCENTTGRPNGTLSGLSLTHGTKYYVTVLACNYAGLCTAKSSDGVLVDTTPPEIQYVYDGLLGEDIDMQAFTNVLFGNWAATDPESDVVSYEVGWGSSPGLDDVWEFQEIGKVTTWYANVEDGGLVKGRRYYVTVRAINGAGLESKIGFSDGVVVGKTEFVLSTNESGLFFFDTVNINDDGLMDDSEIGNTFGSLKIPKGAVDEKIKFQCFSLSEKELKSGTVNNISVVDPEVVRPPKHFKLGNYSFQITAYDPTNNTLRPGYRFEKPVIITLFYDVEQMLKGNAKVVSTEVTRQDINPVLLFWDTENQTWYDASKTCPEPWSQTNRSAKFIKVQVCHLTQFALFWTFVEENGIIEFQKENNGQFSHAVYEENNTVVYTSERYRKQIIFNLVRRKGSTGTVQVTWTVTIQSNRSSSMIISPMSGQQELREGQWNSSFTLQFLAMPEDGPGSTVLVTLVNVSAGATLGDFNAVKIVSLPSRIPRTASSSVLSKILWISLPVASVLFLIFVAICIVRRCRRSTVQYQVFPPEANFEMNAGGFVNILAEMTAADRSTEKNETTFAEAE